MNDILWFLIGAGVGAFGLGAWLSATGSGGGYQPRRLPGAPPARPSPPRGGSGSKAKAIKARKRYQRPRDP